LQKFIRNLDRLDDFDYNGIPRLYEEAMLVYMLQSKKRIDLPGRQISQESIQRFIDFNEVLFGRYGGDKETALNELGRDYGDSFFFYAVYGLSGMKK